MFKILRNNNHLSKSAIVCAAIVSLASCNSGSTSPTNSNNQIQYSNFKTFLFHFYKLLLRRKNLKAWAGLSPESGKQGINPKGDPLGSSPLSI